MHVHLHVRMHAAINPYRLILFETYVSEKNDLEGQHQCLVLLSP